jgi:hypothetical protein
MTTTPKGCAICGCEHELDEVPDTSSMTLCAACTIVERVIRPVALRLRRR